MTKTKSTKRALLMSALALLACVSMLVGSTYAWFTDSVTSGNNKIVSGTLDVDLLMANADGEYVSIADEDAAIFGAESLVAQNDPADTLWEPGKTQIVYLAVENKGSLDLKYNILLNVIDGGLIGSLEYAIIDGAKAGELSDATKWADIENNTNVQIGDIAAGTFVAAPIGSLLATKADYFALAVHMKEEAGNEYQGKDITIDMVVNATQLASEEDSFNDQYDADAAWDGTATYDWYTEGLDNNVFTLSTAADLAGFVEIVNGTVTRSEVTGISTYSDEDPAVTDTFKGKTVKLDTDVNLMNMKWTPIGIDAKEPVDDRPFSGTFDGQGHTISNLFVSMAGKSNAGFFGFTTNGAVKNVTFDNAHVSGRLNVGVVAGTPYTSTYDNITITGDVTVNGMSYVGGAFGKSVYADVTNITIDVNEGSYVSANSIENGTTYRTYVGGVIGFMGEGGHKVTNVTSNIDVIGTIRDVGGITGIAHYGNSFINCTSTGDVTITDATSVSGAEEIGGIAGVWHNNDGYSVTFTDCSYTGTLSVNLTEGVDLSDNTITGNSYTTTGSGKLIVDGVTTQIVQTAEAMAAVLSSGGNAVLAQNIEDAAVNTTAPYGNYYGVALNGGVLNGNGNTLDFNEGELHNGKLDNYGIMTSGGTIKNVTLTGVFRAVMIMNPTETVYIDNVTIGDEDVCYAINTGEGDGTQDVVITNSTIKGWNSYGNAVKSVSFTNCTFAQGEYYTNVFGRLVKPYVNTVFENCEFSSKYYIDLSALTTDGDGRVVNPDAKIVLKNCTVNGVKLTAENWTQLIVSEGDCGEGQISIEGKDGSYMTASNVFDYVTIE